jgi:hypothetical protein
MFNKRYYCLDIRVIIYILVHKHVKITGRFERFLMYKYVLQELKNKLFLGFEVRARVTIQNPYFTLLAIFHHGPFSEKYLILASCKLAVLSSKNQVHLKSQ